MRAERKAAYDKAREDAVKLSYYVQEGQEPDSGYDPAQDFEPAAEHGGFVYELSAIVGWDRSRRRLEKARSFYKKPKPAPSEPKTGLAA